MNNSLSGRRILVIEDEMIVVWMLEAMLADLGCIVVGTVARIEQALATVETVLMPDVVILDINLNGQKSYPVADALAMRGIPFVFSSGYDKQSLPEAYRSFPFLQKPYRQEELASALMKLLPPDEPNSLGSLLPIPAPWPATETQP